MYESVGTMMGTVRISGCDKSQKERHILTVFDRPGTKMGTIGILRGWEGELRGRKCFVLWWAQQDSNLRPADYESAALTN